MKNVYQIKNAKKEIDWITADKLEVAIYHYKRVHNKMEDDSFEKDHVCRKLHPHEMTEKVYFELENESVTFTHLAEMHLTTCVIATNYE